MYNIQYINLLDVLNGKDGPVIQLFDPGESPDWWGYCRRFSYSVGEFSRQK